VGSRSEGGTPKRERKASLDNNRRKEPDYSIFIQFFGLFRKRERKRTITGKTEKSQNTRRPGRSGSLGLSQNTNQKNRGKRRVERR